MRTTRTRPTDKDGDRNKGVSAHPCPPKSCRESAQKLSRVRPKAVASPPKSCRESAQKLSRVRPKAVASPPKSCRESAQKLSRVRPKAVASPPKSCRESAQKLSRVRPKAVASPPKSCRESAQKLSRVRPKAVFLYTKPSKHPFSAISVPSPPARGSRSDVTNSGRRPVRAVTPGGGDTPDRSAPPRGQGHRPPVEPSGKTTLSSRLDREANSGRRRPARRGTQSAAASRVPLPDHPGEFPHGDLHRTRLHRYEALRQR